MGDLDDMGLFALIVRAGSLTAAAEHSGIPTSTLSRRLARLESRLGVPLLQRTTRRMRLTRYGETYLGFCEQVDGAATRAIQTLHAQRDEPVGALTIAASFNVDDGWGAEVLAAFVHRYPGIALNARVLPHPFDVDSIDADLIVVHGEEPRGTRTVRTLGTIDLVLCASPEYAARHTLPHDAATLADHAFVQFGLIDWATHAPASLRHVALRPCFTTNDTLLARQLAVASVGIALLPRLVVSRHLQRGRLVPVMPDEIGSLPAWMVVPRAREASRRVEALEEFIRARARQSAPWNYPG